MQSTHQCTPSMSMASSREVQPQALPHLARGAPAVSTRNCLGASPTAATCHHIQPLELLDMLALLNMLFDMGSDASESTCGCLGAFPNAATCCMMQHLVLFNMAVSSQCCLGASAKWHDKHAA